MHLTLLEPASLIALGQILMIDIVLAGDNAVVIGLAAARVPPALRGKVILWGMVAAVALRIVLSFMAVWLMKSVIGVTLAGGLLLLLVCWNIWREIRNTKPHHATAADGQINMRRAIMQIVLADISMSLDNVLAVAGASHGNMLILAIGLLISVALMGAAANLIARLLERYRWISYIGLLIVLYVAITMIWHGGQEVFKAFG
jgi:YjbE family integral membrane protein